MEGTALPVTDSAARPRRAYLDNLKVVLVVGVIVGHVLITYADVGTWAYRETSGNDAFLIPSALVVALGSLFAMGVFFFIAGLLTPGPLARKGPGGFLRDRALRLGASVPRVPAPALPGREVGGRAWDPAPRLVPARAADRSGPRAAVVRAGPADLLGRLRGLAAGAPPSPGPASDAAVHPGRVRQPPSPWRPSSPGSGSPSTPGRSSSCTSGSGRSASAMFVLGLACAENGWLQPVPARTVDVLASCALVALAAVVVAFAVGRDSIDPFAGGLSWQAVLVAVCEGALAVGLAVWLLGFFQAHADHAVDARAADGPCCLRRLHHPGRGRDRAGRPPRRLGGRAGGEGAGGRAPRGGRLVRAGLAPDPPPGSGPLRLVAHHRAQGGTPVGGRRAAGRQARRAATTRRA